ncbi:sel1 repeat family protein [Rhizobiales bacterium]|uniref:tetratricopeptide repeat protein n=1 Tax=Hongsoonwoonella zoysiae TaxID=2821844 RepID=UPI00155FCA1F|nr:tetratricopeptide repeat protein [Hongsoonwoonella zoysiae]NRG18880.1 sel1 repeat family protein [Hongsoonwoonella zoysiae]
MRSKRSGIYLALLAAATIVAGPALALDEKKATEGGVVEPSDLSPGEALRVGTRFYYSGEKARAVDSLRFAAENGHPLAAWKLGKMYAAGDGVKEDDLKAFEYFRQVASQYGDDSPTSPRAPFVASAFVALGSYYLTGIGESSVQPNVARAREIFTYAASYFGDADAQYQLGKLYLAESSPNKQMAARWLKLAARKGHVDAQGRLGDLLFTSSFHGDAKVRGLMWLNIARASATGPERQWIVDAQERCFGLADESIRRRAERLSNAWLEKNAPVLADSGQ